MATKYYLGTIILVILVSSSYVIFSGESRVKILVGETNSKFYIEENGKFVLTGTETNKLFNGTKSVSAVAGATIKTAFDNTSLKSEITRLRSYYSGTTIFDNYTFDGTDSDISHVPIDRTVEIMNGKGLIYEYYVRDLPYSGETKYLEGNEIILGKNMKVEWNPGNYYARILKTVGGTGTLRVRWKIESNYEVFHNRLFDPYSYYILDNINSSNLSTTANIVYLVNGTNGVMVGGEKQYVWSRAEIVNTTNKFNYSAYNSYAVTNFSGTELPMEVESGNGTSYNSTQLYDNDVMAYLRFGTNSSMAYDSTKNGRNYNINSNAYWNSGIVAGGMRSRGIISSATNGANRSFESWMEMENFTMIAWINPTGVALFDRQQIIVFHDTGKEDDIVMEIGQGGGTFQTGTVSLLVDNGGSFTYCSSTESLIINNTWQQIAVTFDKSAGGTSSAMMKIFYNGRIVKSCATNVTTPIGITAGYSGIAKSTNNDYYQFNGTIDEVFISNVSKSDDFIRFNYQVINKSLSVLGSISFSQSGNPNVTIKHPTTNAKFNNSHVDLNITTNMTYDTLWYILDSGENTTFTPNITLDIYNQGSHTVKVCVNGTAAVVNCTAKTFTMGLKLVNISTFLDGLSINRTYEKGTIVMINATTNVTGSVISLTIDTCGLGTNVTNSTTYLQYNWTAFSCNNKYNSNSDFYNVTFTNTEEKYVNASLNIHDEIINASIIIKGFNSPRNIKIDWDKNGIIDYYISGILDSLTANIITFNDSTDSKLLDMYGGSNTVYFEIPIGTVINSSSFSFNGFYGYSNDSVDLSRNATEVDMTTDYMGGRHICYYDQKNNDSVYAYKNNSGWITENIESVGNVGRYCVIRTSGNYVHVAYWDVTNHVIKEAFKNIGQNAINWTRGIVANPDDDSGIQVFGFDEDNNGNGHLCFVGDYMNDYMNYTKFNNTVIEINTNVGMGGYLIGGSHCRIAVNSTGPYILHRRTSLSAAVALDFYNGTSFVTLNSTLFGGFYWGAADSPYDIKINSTNHVHVSFTNSTGTLWHLIQTSPVASTFSRYVIDNISSGWGGTSKFSINGSAFATIYSNSTSHLKLAYHNGTSAVILYDIDGRKVGSISQFGSATFRNNNIIGTWSDSGFKLKAFERSYPSNITIDVGNNGTMDYNYSVELSQQIYNQTISSVPFTAYLSNCTETLRSTCNVPLVFRSLAPGKLNISSISIVYNITSIPIPNSTIQSVLNAGNNLSINVTATNGIIEFRNLSIFYSGTSYVNISAKFYGNLTHASSYSYLFAKVVASRFSIRMPYNFTNDILFYQSSNDTINVTPYGQTNTIPIMNITTLAYDEPVRYCIYATGNIQCFQEFANQSSGCGGIANGTYSADMGAVADGDWNSYITAISGYYKYINYIKVPSERNTSIWRVKDNAGQADLNDKTCYNAFSNFVMLRVYMDTMVCGGCDPLGFSSRKIGWDCWNGTWIRLRETMGNASTTAAYEEAWIHDMSLNDSAIKITVSNTSTKGTITLNSTGQVIYNNSIYNKDLGIYMWLDMNATTYGTQVINKYVINRTIDSYCPVCVKKGC